jgi:hypothetical protein
MEIVNVNRNGGGGKVNGGLGGWCDFGCVFGVFCLGKKWGRGCGVSGSVPYFRHML